MPFLLAETAASLQQSSLLQTLIDGLTFGSLIAMVALGYTMVYGIIGLINFAHGDLFMLGSFLALTVVQWFAGSDSSASLVVSVVLSLLLCGLFCSTLNVGVERLIYRPLRHSPKLVSLVSAIGVSFVFMNIGQLWKGASPISFPTLIPDINLAASVGLTNLRFMLRDAIVIGVTVPVMIGLTLFVKGTKLGKAMRATEQNTIAAKLMGIDSDFVIATTFAIGGALAGLASVVYCMYVGQVDYQMGFKNGLYAFTAAVLGGIGKLPGAVLGGLIIGVVYSLAGYLGIQKWESALVFGILILILVFRPTGLLGSPAKEKV
jgi:branched-chain amino acid transport system permease protein